MISKKIKKSTKDFFLFIGKNKEKSILFVELILIVGVSFFSGYFFAIEKQKSVDVNITKNATILNSVFSYQKNIKDSYSLKENQDIFYYVASKKGRVYYKIGCKNKIKEENKIFFKTKKEAEDFGFKPSKRCFGK